MAIRVMLCIVGWLGAVAAVPAGPVSVLRPAVYGDFGHYTFALTWQPGFCTTSRERCVARQPHAPLIGLHGLWASRPQRLVAQGVPRVEWWRRGCDLLHHSDAAPHLAPAVARRIDAVMPHLPASLLVHEYDKHVQCFGFDTNAFFATELAMRDAVVASPFGAYLRRNVGRIVRHDDVVAVFDRTFRIPHSTSLQLQCARNDDGAVVLTQFWITVRRQSVAAFPAPSSLMDTEPNQDTCPASFAIPAWPR